MSRHTATLVGAFVLLSIAWGATFPLTKVVLPLVAPAQVVLVRVVSGFAALVVFSSLAGVLRWSHLRHWPHFLVMSFLATTLYYLAYALAANEMQSGVASVLSGAAPLFVFVLAAVFLPDETLTRQKAAGVALGLIGIALTAEPWKGWGSAENSPMGFAYLLGGAGVFSFSFIYARRFVAPLKIPSAALVTYQLGFASLFVLIAVPKTGLTDALTDAKVVGALVLGLGVLGTGVAYLLYYFIVQRIGAISASASIYLSPAVGLAMSVTFLAETIAWSAYVAMALILTGVWLLREVEPKQTRQAPSTPN